MKTKSSNHRRKIFGYGLLSIVILLLLANPLHAQNILTLTLDECLRIARTKSPAARMAMNNYEVRRYAYKAFRAGLYPQLSLDGYAPNLQRTITNIRLDNATEQFLEVNQLSGRTSLSLSQQIAFTGGSLSLSSGINRIDNLSDNNTSFYWGTTPFQITLSQPLFQLNTLAWNMEEEELRYESGEKKYAEAMEDIAIDATGKFFDVYIYAMDVKNAELNVAINDTLYQLSKGRFKVGKIAENDLLQSELALSNVRLRLETARLNYLEAVEKLLITLGIEGEEEIEVIPPAEVPTFDVDVEKAIEQAFKNRSDVIDQDLRKLRAERSIEQAEDNSGFNATLSASFGLNQTSEKLPEAYQNLLDQEFLNITFSVPVFQWGKGSSEVESAMAEKESVGRSVEIERRELERRVKYQALRFLQLQKQVPISAKADTIASRRFLVAKNRYMIGKIDMNSLFIAQNEKDQALQSYIQKLKSYWIAYYTMRRLTLYDFEKGRPFLK